MRRNLNLLQSFDCHLITPQFGFEGELRHMVREDMNLLQAIRYHNQTWGFKFQDGYVPLTHEIPHQFLAIACIYNPQFSFLLPSIDPNTAFLKPNGYNGFSDGEDFVTSIEHGLLKAIIYQKFNKADLSKSTFMQQIMTVQASNPTEKYLDQTSWVLAHQNSTPISIHDIKKDYGYDTRDLKIAFQTSINKAEPPNHLKNTRNKHGEHIQKQRIFNPDDYECLYDTIIAAISYLDDIYVSSDATLNDIDRIWGNIKIRDLHILIGGENNAEKYFKSCNSPNTEKAAKLLTALPQNC